VALKVPKPVRQRMGRFLNIGDIVKTLQKDGVDVKELLKEQLEAAILEGEVIASSEDENKAAVGG
jgi:hypothetical protein